MVYGIRVYSILIVNQDMWYVKMNRSIHGRGADACTLVEAFKRAMLGQHVL